MDLVASGVITRVPESEELAAKLKSASPGERPSIYAAAGIWYDSLESVSDLINASPADKELHAQRADLLRQVGLAGAADSDK